MSKLELKFPVFPYVVVQKFGENLSCINPQGHVVTKGTNSCPIGFADFYISIGMLGHNGEDVATLYGQPVYAAHDGWVDEVSTEVNRGLGVGLRTHEMFDFEGGTYYARTRYWHFKGMNVKMNDLVKCGDLIGWADSTGNSSGNHLHFELIPYVNGNIFPNNGYFGKVDPHPYWTGKYAQEKFLFLRDLELGQDNDEVARLQMKLQQLGYFPLSQKCTGFYGAITRAAVFTFQTENITNLSFKAKNLYRGRYFAQQSRDALNKL